MRLGGERTVPEASRWWGSRTSGWVVLAAGVLLAGWYTDVYLGDPLRPGANPAAPEGWWAWFDQSRTLLSLVSLLRDDFTPLFHHYPLGYSLLGLPFYLLMPAQPFFLLDLLCLLGAFGGFVALARRLGVPGPVAAGLFGIGTLSAPILFRQWVLPWNTTPVAACMWLLLALVAAWMDGRRRPIRAGLLMGVVLACRPSDALMLIPMGAALLWAERRDWRGGAGAAVRMAAAGAAVLLPVLALHVRIFGWAESPYMIMSGQIGFTLQDFWWKFYVLFLDPYPWFADGEGIIQRSHWVALGLAGLLPALIRAPKDRLLAAVLLVHGILYVSYVDLLPIGLWRFFNVHYFAWAYPGYALVAGLLVRDLIRPRAAWVRWAGLGAAGLTLVVLCVRVLPVPAGGAAKAVDFAGPLPPYVDTMFIAPLELRDGLGPLAKGLDYRAILYPNGVRVIALRRALSGPIAWVPGHAPVGFEGSVPVARWTTRVQLAWPPVWLRRATPPAIPIPTE